MSYEIVKAIKIKDGVVFVNCASNNVYPKTYDEFKSESLTKILTEQGEQALNIELLKEYENGNFQGHGNKNKFTRALEVLYYVYGEEYKPFNWRDNNFNYGTAENKAYEDRRNSEAFKMLLLKALNTKLPKEKFIVMKKSNYNGVSYVKKETSRHIFYTNDKEQAKVFNFKQQAEQIANMNCLKGISEVVSINTTQEATATIQGTAQSQEVKI